MNSKYTNTLSIVAVFAGAVAVFSLCVFILLPSKKEPPKTITDLQIYRDAGTGCEYVRIGSTGLPRMNKDGKQVCGDPIPQKTTTPKEKTI